MIAAIKSRNSRQFEWALWTPKGKNAEKNKPRWIQVERLTQRMNTFNTTAGNIVTPSRKITVQTHYFEAYERNDWVKWRNRLYMITSISESVEDAPQALKYASPEYEKIFILELMELEAEPYIEN